MNSADTDHPLELVDLGADDAAAMPEPDLDLDEVPSEDWQKGFTINGEHRAEWAMRHLAELRADEARDADLYQYGLDRLDAWAARRAKSREWGISFFERHLEDYARRQCEVTKGRRKSVDLPSGVVRTSTSKARIVVADKPVFLIWAAVHDRSLVRFKGEPDASAIKAALTMTDDGVVVDPVSGEVVPGLAVKPESLEVSVKPHLGVPDAT